MNIDEWINLPPAQFAEKLRDAQMSREEYDRAVAGILADQRMVEEMRAKLTALETQYAEMSAKLEAMPKPPEPPAAPKPRPTGVSSTTRQASSWLSSRMRHDSSTRP